MKPQAQPPPETRGAGRQADRLGGGVGPSHQFLEHTGELHLRVRGGSLADVLAEAGRALGGLALRRPAPPANGPWQEVVVGSDDRVALLVDWLNELIYRAEAASEVPTEFEILEVDERHVRARVRGVGVEQPPALVKAATLHGAALEPTEGGLQADVVLDV